MRRGTRWALWAMLTVAIALSSLALAAGPKPKGGSKAGAGKSRPRVAVKDAGPPTHPSTASDAASDLSAGDGASAAQAQADVKMLDSGARVLRFGELEIEGRLRSPQIVYFLRRVRAEFAAEDLGHRTFLRELSETRKEPNF